MSPEQVRRASLAVLLLRLNEAHQAEGLITRWRGADSGTPHTEPCQVADMLSKLRKTPLTTIPRQ